MTTDTKISPMMKQWHDCKAQCGTALLFFRLGDFYEAFYDDAVTLSKELDLTLTKRQEIPMAGVPFHHAETYIDRLVSKGFRVAVAEQLEDPKEVKGIVSREIVRIITPGSVITSSLLCDKRNNFIACIQQVNRTFALALLDLTTADFRVFEFDTITSLVDELYRAKPKELIVSHKCFANQKILLQELSSELGISLLTRDDWQYDLQATVNFLTRHFRLHSLDSFGMKGMSCSSACAGALLSYVQNELNLSIDHITSIQKEVSSEYMSLDSATQKHLELTDSLHEKQKGYTLLSILDETSTAMGARMLSHWLLHPLRSIDKIHKRQEGVEFFLSFSHKEALKKRLQEVRDLERLIMRIDTGFASPRDFVALGSSLAQIGPITSLLSKESMPPLLTELVAQLPDAALLCETIQRALVDEPPLRLSEGGVFRSGFHSELDELRAIQTDSHQWLVDYQAALRSSTLIKTLKVGYTKAFGYYIEVSRGQADKIPEGFDRRQTLVNAERFITRELKEYEHKMLSAEERIGQIESELFLQLRKQISQSSSIIRQIAQAVGHIDTLFSLSVAAMRKGFVRPVVDDSALLHIEAGRHPVIESCHTTESFIANDVYLDDKHSKLYLITGPNMAGKSTFIRQVALITILAQIGSFVPAQRAHIGIVDKVFTRIGASDNLSRGQSTFMVEMSETAHILHNATSKSLVILDEIGRGTSTYDGISIAWAVAEYLLTTPGKMPKTLFATHYCEMTELENKIPGALNYHIAVHESDTGIVFLRKIVRGATDKSYGIHVARLAGLPPSVIKKAKEVLKELEEQEGESVVKKNKDLNQLSLFTQLPSDDTSPILNELRVLDPDVLSPRQALDKLIAWKALL